MNIIDAINKKEGLIIKGGISEEQIREAQDLLEVIFSDEYKEYLRVFGQASYYGHELTGLGSAPYLDVVGVTKEYRSMYGTLPSDMYVIEDLNMDGIVCCQNSIGEIFAVSSNIESQKVSDSLCGYLQKD